MKNENLEALKNGGAHSVGLRRVASMRESTRGMPAGEAGVVFFRRGEPRLNAIKFIGQDVVISRMQILQRFSAFTVPDPAWLCFHIPLSWNGDYFFNGQELNQSEAVFAECPNGYFTRGADRDALTLGFRKEALAGIVGQLLNRPAQDISLPDIVLRPSAEFMAFMGSIFVNTNLDKTRSGTHDLSDLTEQTLLDLMAAQIINNIDGTSEVAHRNKRSSEIVGLSIELLSQRRGQTLSLSDLCGLTGVGSTRLFQSFEEIQGMSPYKYMRLIRLDYAYSRLSDLHDPPASIKHVALDLGYSKPGRFAEQFKAQFGELPSNVLRKTLMRSGIAS